MLTFDGLCLLCSAPMMGVVQGVMMELDDCAFPLLTSQSYTSLTTPCDDQHTPQSIPPMTDIPFLHPL